MSTTPAPVPLRLEGLAGVRGVDGVRHSGGQVDRRWDRFRSVREWAEEADRMRLDARIILAWEARASDLRSASWTVRESPTGSAKAARYADIVRRALGLDGRPGLMHRTFGEFVDEAAWFAYYGSLPFEMVWRYDVRAGLACLSDAEVRIPSSILRWGDGEDLGPLTQIAYGHERQPEPIPGRKLLLFTRGRLGSDWLGQGLARAAWSAYARRSKLIDLRTVALARLGVLAPQVEYDPQRLLDAVAMMTGSSGQGEARQMVQDVAQLVARVQAGDAAVLVTLRDILDVRWNTQEGFDPTPLLDTDEREIQEIYAAFGVLWLTMGTGSEGSGNRSLGEVHASMTRRQVIADADCIAATLNGRWRDGGGLVGALCELNDPDGFDETCLPTIAHQGLEVDAFAELLPSLPGLVSSGLYTPDDATEDAIRALADVPALPEDARRSQAVRRVDSESLLARVTRLARERRGG